MNYWIELGLGSDVFVMNSLIAMYSKCKRVDIAVEIFENFRGKWIHGHVIRYSLENSVFVMTALVDMYAKFGGVHAAKKLFSMTDEQHVITWNVVIDGTWELLEKMLMGFKPNDVTFQCILSACSHSGLSLLHQHEP
ncbi:hypothetical protein HHK36_018344 [Tetracentron sinense]|uniref:Pentatricopeptide repeat-containing protein n=1 Tax=Tetracentron sinense TaxID=13715 RepID=A0A834YYJ6_TETSI|nr:hypothetical protein HHK36_018344 [Tetracentron sinense]